MQPRQRMCHLPQSSQSGGGPAFPPASRPSALNTPPQTSPGKGRPATRGHGGRCHHPCTGTERHGSARRNKCYHGVAPSDRSAGAGLLGGSEAKTTSTRGTQRWAKREQGGRHHSSRPQASARKEAEQRGPCPRPALGQRGSRHNRKQHGPGNVRREQSLVPEFRDWGTHESPAAEKSRIASGNVPTGRPDLPVRSHQRTALPPPALLLPWPHLQVLHCAQGHPSELQGHHEL